MLPKGIYEQVLNELLRQQIAGDLHFEARTKAIDPAESAQVLAQYLGQVIEQALVRIRDTDRSRSSHSTVERQTELANKVIELLSDRSMGAIDQVQTIVRDPSANLLTAIVERNPAATDFVMVRPETSLARSSLFTGAVQEPSLFTELQKEIHSADRIDMLVSFIKWSGLRLIMEDLRRYTQLGKPLRIITTTYLGATDDRAIHELMQLPNTEIRISYDTKRTRLHAKAYVFHRDSGFTTAYVGSSNLSNAAISSGLEWNVKVTAQDLPQTLQKIEATFESYWYASEFEAYSTDQYDRLRIAIQAERKSTGQKPLMPQFFDIRPYPYQQEILDQLAAERLIRGHFRNLVVAATGTGKTVVAAFDYLRFRKQRPQSPSRLLFVAHREEILQQSLATFRGVLRDANFGELFVGQYRPSSLDHVFISVQTFASQAIHEQVPADFYDFIIIDETHRAAAESYHIFFAHFQPAVFLGLTATPERLDGDDIFKFYGDRIAAEIRLPEAIERKLLSPFHYFGVTDTVDYKDLHWVRGGYDRAELSNLLTINQGVAIRRAEHVAQAVLKYVADIGEVKGLGFCVSVEHAEFMTARFAHMGIPAASVHGRTPTGERFSAPRRLLSGEIQFIFTVDLFNEGVDLPEINTILFLRPTESLTVFLQQLGRGLRLAKDKDCLTVLDFVGQAHRKYNFEAKFAALLPSSKANVEREIKDQFSSLPKGCYIQLERLARQYILDNIRQSFSGRAGLVGRISCFTEDSGLPLTLANFLAHHRLDPQVIYKTGFSFTRLCVLANTRPDFDEPGEKVITKSLPRIANFDSHRLIGFLRSILKNFKATDLMRLSLEEKGLLQLLYITIWNQAATDWNELTVTENLLLLEQSPIMRTEIDELLAISLNRIDFVESPLDLGFPCPLALHCQYSMKQIMGACGEFNFGAMQGLGVKYLPSKKLDIFLVTLNKSERDYSPTTLYNDYSISESLFHWQSQSTTSSHTQTGQRYIHHRQRGSNVLLFVRESKQNSYGTLPYTCLGLADYVEHQGDAPMNIIWRLHQPIPVKFLKMTNKLIV